MSTTPRGPQRLPPPLWEDSHQLHHPHGPKRPCQLSWPQTSLSLRPHQATKPPPPAGVRPPFLTGSKWLLRHTFHTEASHSIYVRTGARERRTQRTHRRAPEGKKTLGAGGNS